MSSNCIKNSCLFLIVFFSGNIFAQSVLNVDGGAKFVMTGTVKTVIDGGTNLKTGASKIIMDGGTLTINGINQGVGQISGSPSSTLIIGGAGGSLNFDQTTASTRSLKDLTLNSAATLSLGNALDIAAGLAPGTVIINSGAALTTNGFLTLKSDDAGTARVGNSAGLINGFVTVERNIKAITNKRAWHLLSTTTTGSQTIYNAWQEGGVNVANQGTLITSHLYDGGTNGFDMTSISASILTHNQGLTNPPSWNFDLPSTKSTLLSSYPGYMLFVRGDRNFNAANAPATNRTVLRSTGALRQGILTPVTVSATGTGRTLVGNPYASPIDIDPIFTGTANLNQNMYVWDPVLTGNHGVGGFRLVERNVGGTYQQTPVVLGGGPFPDASSRYIHSGQAFFLKATGSDASVVFNENHKTSLVSAVNPIVNTPGDQQLFVNLLTVNPGNEASLADGIRVRFDGVYSAGPADDIEKMGNFAENISSFRNNKKWIVEKRPMIVSTDTIFLRMTNTGIKDYRFHIGTFDFVQTNATAYLKDSWLNTITGLDLTGNIDSMDFSITADPASANQDRFQIIFALSGPLPVTITSVKAAQQGNHIAVEWKAANQYNMKQYEVEKSTDGINFTKVNTQSAIGTNGTDITYTWLDVNPVAGNNYYRIRSIGLDADVKISKVVVVKIGKTNAAITVYPNPVTDHNLGIMLNNMQQGMYQIRLINNLGQLVATKMITHGGGSAAQTIQLDRKIAMGSYQLEIIKPDKTKTTTAIQIAD